MKRKLPFLLLLIVGVCIFLFPFASSAVSSMQQARISVQYDQAVSSMGGSDLAAQKARADRYNGQITGVSPADPFTSPDTSAASGGTSYYDALDIGGVMGYLEIPRIHADLPIYHGTGKYALARGVGHLEGTSLPVGGTDTHAVLTGHSGLPTAALLNGLDKMEVGDLFYIKVLGQTLVYQVDQIQVVEPSQTDALMIVKGQDLCTLLTCTPYGINSHRLLVRGMRVPASGNAPAPAPPSLRPWLLAGAAGVVIPLATVLVRRHRKQKGGESSEKAP